MISSMLRPIIGALASRKSVDSWWLSGGISPANVVAAYQPKGAASLVASYTNLANPGTYNAAPGVAPSFDPLVGWIATTSQWLTTGVNPAGGYTYICRYSNVVDATGQGCLFGRLDIGATRGVYYQPLRSLNKRNHVNGGNTASGEVSPSQASGVVAIAGNKAYFGGLDLGVTLSDWVGAPSSSPLYLFRLNYSTALPVAASMQAFAIYSTTLTAPQVLAISTAMAAL